MKYLTYIILIGFVFGISMYYLPLNFALMVTALLIAILYGIVVELRDRKERLLATNRYDDYFVISDHPETGKEVYFGEFQKYVSSVPFDKVEAEKERLEKLLYSVGNEWINPKQIPADKLLRVHTYIYQHGERVSEDWEQFEEYVLLDMKKKLETRHKWLSRHKQVWYSRVKDQQTGYQANWLSVFFQRV